MIINLKIRMDADMQSIDIRELALKCRSKHEIYNKFTVSGGLYLPKESDVNNDYISDIMQGRKRYSEL